MGPTTSSAATTVAMALVGCGSDTVYLESDIGIYSPNAQKQSDSSGTLTLTLNINGEEVDKTSPFAAYGIASVTGQAR
jgi:hypothetical protein